MWEGQDQNKLKVDPHSRWFNGEDKIVSLPPIGRKIDMPFGASLNAINLQDLPLLETFGLFVIGRFA